MHEWAWPQTVLLFLMIFWFIIQTVSNIRDKDVSSNSVAIAFMIRVAMYAAQIGLLHAGGFW